MKLAPAAYSYVTLKKTRISLQPTLVERRGNYLNSLNKRTPIQKEDELEPLMGNIERENDLVTSDAKKTSRPQLRLVKENTFKQKDANGKKISNATLDPWDLKNQHPPSKQSVGSLPNLYFTDM
ncbi:unnamed protein product [Porites lobata]|uniref:Uncharacterized protein n=1 Tax=Porites lobata TaxID=104759 RepID=A0ABN8P753_9CNID|nr:unnamed protein product [Porites lobata]